LVTGRAQAVMVHVNVGLANSVMGVINAASDNIPMLVMSGRTPISERGRKGARMTPIQYGQEMFDQTSLVRDLVKYSYEMRYPEQGKQLVMRAMSLATSEPQGPVYLSLPKEPLSEIVPEITQTHHPMPPSATKILPDPEAIIKLARLLETASNPVIICQRGDTEGRLSRALSTLAAKHGIAVFEPFLLRNVLPSNDPPAGQVMPTSLSSLIVIHHGLRQPMPQVQKPLSYTLARILISRVCQCVDLGPILPFRQILSRRFSQLTARRGHRRQPDSAAKLLRNRQRRGGTRPKSKPRQAIQIQ